jgi:hypothetical protein
MMAAIPTARNPAFFPSIGHFSGPLLFLPIKKSKNDRGLPMMNVEV